MHPCHDMVPIFSMGRWGLVPVPLEKQNTKEKLKPDQVILPMGPTRVGGWWFWCFGFAIFCLSRWHAHRIHVWYAKM